MKMLLLTYEYPPFKGGVATYLSNLMKAVPPGVEIVVDVPPKKEYWMKTAWRLFFNLRKAKPDLVAISHVLPAGYIAAKIKFWYGIPYLVFTHGTDILSARKNPWKRFWMRFILKRAKIVIANSRFTASLLKEEGIQNVEIVPPSIVIPERTSGIQSTSDDRSPSKDWIPASAGMTKKEHEIISIGRLVPRKGFDTLIKAMPAVIKEVPDAHLIIIGSGSYFDELDRLAHELRVENFIEILTKVTDDEKNRHLQSAAIFALPTRQVGSDIEGFGIVTLEASAAGLPVIVTNSGGAAEPVVDRVTGYIIGVDSLSQTIIALLKDPAQAKKMGEAGRQYIAKEYSIDTIGKMFWSIVIPKHPSTGSG